MPCALYYDPRILCCPYGDSCRDAHTMKSAREVKEAEMSRSSSRESNGSQNQNQPRRQETRFTPAFNPNHPDIKKAASGNAYGQRMGAPSAQAQEPQSHPQAQQVHQVHQGPRSGGQASLDPSVEAARALSSERQGRQRVDEILTQRSSSQAHLAAMEDPVWKQRMEAAEAALKSAFITKQSDPQLDKEKQA